MLTGDGWGVDKYCSGALAAGAVLRVCKAVCRTAPAAG